MKIFIGSDDVASILSGTAQGFKKLGHDVTSFVFERNKFYPDASYDLIGGMPLRDKINYNENKLLRPFSPVLRRIDDRLLRRSLQKRTDAWIKEFDLFIFVWRPWLSEEELFQKIKAAGKKIVCLRAGSDVRHIAAYRQEYAADVSLWEKYFHDEDINNKIRKIRTQELYADLIYSVPDQEGLSIRPYNHLYLPIPGSERIEFKIPTRRDPHIIHAPSRSGIKGTPLIVQAVERLKSEGFRFTFELIQNLSNPDLLKKLTEADILIDELLLHGPGVLSAEAMFAGCAVATRTLDNHKDIFNPPVLSINPTNIFTQIKYLLEDYDYRISLAEKGRQFAVQFNDPEKIAAGIIHDLELLSSAYEPSFYIEKFILPGETGLDPDLKAISGQLATLYYKGQKKFMERASTAGVI